MAGHEISPPPLEAHQVHVWSVRLEHAPGSRERARSALRTILGTYLGANADTLAIVNGAGGKPQLARERHLRFNLSHSGGVALIAVARDREVGVDVERIDARRAAGSIAKRFFAREELAQLGEGHDVAEFFSLWTAKEAYLKALGTGLGRALDGFVISDSTTAPALTFDRQDRTAPARWKLARPSVPDGYAGCLASEGEPFDLVQLSASV